MRMTFDDIPNGESIYLDASVLLYWFTGEPECSGLLDRCKRQQIHGIISTVTLYEVCYKAMRIEAEQATGEKQVTIQQLRRRPDVLKQLHRYANAVEELAFRSNLGYIDITATDIARSHQVRQRYGFLTADSIVARIVWDYGIPGIATTDPDFEVVEGIQVFGRRLKE